MADMFVRSGDTNYKVITPYIRQGDTVYRLLAKYQNVGGTIYNLFSANLVTWFRYKYYYEDVTKDETFYSVLDDEYPIGEEGSFIDTDDFQMQASSKSEDGDSSVAVVCSSYTFSSDEGFKSEGTIYGTTWNDLRIGYYVVTATRVFYITDSTEGEDESSYIYTIVAACRKETEFITSRELIKIQYDDTVYGEIPKYSEDDYYIGEGSIEEGEFTLYDFDGEPCFDYFRKSDINTTTKTVDVTIFDTKYTLPKGTTWREFVSEYNTTNAEGYKEFIIRNGYVYAYSSDITPDDPYLYVVYWEDGNATLIKASYPIDAFGTYNILDE